MIKPQVLIVDDEPVNQFLIDGLLTENGYETLIAENGIKCLEILEQRMPDLILLDIMMPVLSGIEVLSKIVNSDTWNNIPVIMVTAKTDVLDVKEALDLGAIDYIKKPFNEVELLARVKVGIRLKKNEDSLRELVNLRDDFVKIISHDLRSPFTAINGFVEMMLKDDSLSERHKKSLGFILNSVGYSNEYFNKLLAWITMNHTGLQLSKIDSDLYELVSNIFIQFRDRAKDKKVELINETNKDTVINVDRAFFSQVIANLVNNAIKFTSENGWVKCFTRDSDDGIAVIISDNGIGMPDEITPEILFQNDLNKSNRGTKGEKGTGIGLGICKKILDAHQAKIYFESNATGGTDFIIEL
jgi:signal transduction histidine kinase